MNTSLAHLPAIKREQLQAITRVIVSTIRPEKIILFGMYGSSGAGQELFADHRFASILGSFDLLIVTRRGDRRHDHEVQDIIENRCRLNTSVTVLVHDIDYVNTRLSEGHYFFSMLRQEAVLVHDAGNIPFVAGCPPDLAQIKAIAQKDFERWGLQAKAFFRSAVFNQEQQERKIAAFLLHQAAEHTYQAILLAFTGYKPSTHNLDKLRRYTNRFSVQLALLFPRHNKEEEDLFKLLLHAYVDARYKEDYCISEGELNILIERIAELLSIAERVCKNRFASLDKMANIT